MDHEMVCNFKRCRKAISKWAWVTSCSHIFCDEDGTKEFNKSFFCPACETNLSGKFDILRIDLQPSEQSKSMLLAGHKPETILEVCSRAMAFWTYQMHQELMYQQYVSSKAKERNTQLEQYYEQIITRSQTEMNALKSQVNSTRKDLEETRRKLNEVSEKMTEKSRQYHKLQALYDNMRLRTINPMRLDSEGDHASRHLRVQPSTINMGISSTVDDVFGRLSSNDTGGALSADQVPQRDRGEFVFRPASTPILSTSRDAAAAFQQRFNMQLGTPGTQSRQPQDRHPKV